MSNGVVGVQASATLEEVAACLAEHTISSVLVLDGDRPDGVLSRTDLVRLGRREAAGHGAALLTLPLRRAAEVASRPIRTIRADESVSVAAARMAKHRIHRLFVAQGGWFSGVFSTRDLLGAIANHGVETPIAHVMSEGAFTIPASATIAHATDRLLATHASGIVVVDEEEWPLGIYTSTEALAARHLPSTSPVEAAMNPSILCMHGLAPLHRAAALAAASNARRILVIERRRRCTGVVSPLDMARAVSVC